MLKVCSVYCPFTLKMDPMVDLLLPEFYVAGFYENADILLTKAAGFMDGLSEQGELAL